MNASVDTADTDWQGAVMIDNAPVHSHTLSVQGGGDRTTYYLSANYSDQKGVIISNYNRAFRIRMNLDHELNKVIKVGNSISISRQEDGDQNNGSNSLGGSIASTLRLLPNVSPYNAANITGFNITFPTSNQIDKGPNASTIDDNFSNVAYTLRKDKYYSDKYRILDNAYIEVSPAKGLKLRSQVGVDMLNDYSLQAQNSFHGDSYGKGYTYNVDQNWLRLVWSNYINYNYSVSGHNVFLTAGNEVQKETYKWFSSEGQVLSDPFFISENIITNAASTKNIGGNYDVRGFQSFFGRINYDYKSKYFAQATIRRDGQSSLAPGKKYGTFPGYSVGYRPSEEAFWKNSPELSKVINDAKIKASYGKVGNPLTGYLYLTTFGNAPYGNLSGINPTGVGNSALQWETSSKYDLGLELGILNSRFTVGFDWFLNDQDNLVMDVPQPLSAGLVGSLDLNGGTISQNIAKVQNKGIELSLNASLVRSADFSWDLNANYSKVKNEVISLYSVGGAPVPFVSNGAYNVSRVGDPMNILWGYEYAGVNSANGNPMWYKADGTLVQLSLTPGSTANSFYVAKSMSDGTLGASSSLTGADKKNLGISSPTYFGSVTNTFNYKNFGLDIMFRYSGGNKIMNYTRQEALFNMSFQNNGKDILNRWTAPGQITDVPKLYYGLSGNMNNTSNASSRWVEDGDYIRLQNVVLSYNLDSRILARTKDYIKSVRVYLQGQNLHVWTKYKGADPDNISALGVDAAVTPQVRTLSFGLSVGF